VVQLWQSVRGASTAVILVQIQKVQGCSFEFQEVRNDISNAILSGQRAMSPTTSQQQLQTAMICNDFLSNTTKRHDSLPFDAGSSSSCDRHDGTTISAVHLSLQLLKSKLASETRLGLESLVVLTDPSKTMREAVDSASRAVLFDTSSSGIQRLLTDYFALPLETSSSQDDMAIDDHGEEYRRRVHMIALRILSNALEWVATTSRHQQHEHQEGCSSVDLSSSASPFWQRVWQSISYNLRLASQKPQEAILSIRCLRFLMLLQPMNALLEEEGSQEEKQQGTSWWTDGCLTDWLLDANRYGKQYNLSLEQETKKLLTSRRNTLVEPEYSFILRK
jgi:hypothetical protein